MITDLRNHLYEATLRRSSSFFHKHATGTILSTLINDVDRVQTAVSSVIGEFLQQFFTFLVGWSLVIRLGGQLSWALLLFIPVVVTSSRKIGREVRTRTRTGQDKLAEIQNILHETVTGNRIVKAFNTELWEILRFKKAASRLFRANLRSVRIQSISSPLMDTIGAIAIALLLFDRPQRDPARPHDHGHLRRIHHPALQALRSGAQVRLLLQQLPAGDGRVVVDLRLLRRRGRREGKAARRRVEGLSQAVHFENVGFSYSTEEGEHQILHNVDLEVQRRRGAGPGRPQRRGQVHAGQSDPALLRCDLRPHSHRRPRPARSDPRLAAPPGCPGYAGDHPLQRHGAQQHRLRPAGCESDLVEQAARNALAHDFILRMPQGYDTVIGEKGFRLSGGERQRMAIARAILKNAPILILDEATSALDAESESLVQAALANLMQGRTVLVIAHRLSTIRRANRIAVLEDGRITAIGSHEELLTTSPTYQRLYQLQFMDVPETPAMNPDTRRYRQFATGAHQQAQRSSKNADLFDDRVCAGAGSRVNDQLSYTLSVKSVNHRFLDVQLRLPSGLDALEMELRKALKETLVRGHVDLTLCVDRTSAADGRLQSRTGGRLCGRLRCGARRVSASTASPT